MCLARRPSSSDADALLRRLGRTFLLGDKHFRDDAHVRFPPVAALHGAIRESHGAVSMYVRLSPIVHGDAAHERYDFRFLIELDLLLSQPASHIGPPEDTIVDGPDRREMGALDVVLFSKFGQAGHDFVTLRHVDPVSPGALTEVGHLHSGSESFPRTKSSLDVSLRSR